jgi:hypothetical protein
MGLFNWSFRSGGDERLMRVAQRIAEQSLGEVSRRVNGLTADMSAAEARGYIRARAAGVVHRQVATAIRSDDRLRPADRARLINMATETLVLAISRQRQTIRRPLAA